MHKREIKVQIKTISNLFIGGSPTAFEIGGIDQYTVADSEGNPYIPASSLKGTLRAVVRDRDSGQDEKSEEIKKFYEEYLSKQKDQASDLYKKDAQIAESLEKLEENYNKKIDNVSAEYLFGIEGFNDTPKFILSDFRWKKEDNKNWYSIDTKNLIETKTGTPESKPRTYKSVRNGLIFVGEIYPYRLDAFGEEGTILCIEYIKEALMEFNKGIYRLGNSKSRGYGKVEVTILEEGREGNA